MITMPIMKENEFSPFGKAVLVIGIVVAADPEAARHMSGVQEVQPRVLWS